MARKLNTEEFVVKAKKVHGNKYDYSKSIYKTSQTKLIITCSTHGDFLQKPNDHLMGKGCRNCYCDRANSNLKLGLNDFITRAKQIHGDKYGYTKIVYKNIKTKVTITCPIHGDFEQTPFLHLKTHGCKLCRKENKLIVKPKPPKKVFDTTWFINRSKQIFGDGTLDYTETRYCGYSKKVTLKCKKHNINFKQIVSNHLKGQVACPECLYEKHGQRKNGYWIYDRCYNTAKKYEWLSDFSKQDFKCYDASKEKGYLKDFIWLKRNYDLGENIAYTPKHLIYGYLFENEKVCYIGLTVNLQRRHKNGHKRLGQVFEYCRENNIEVPEPNILEDRLHVNEVRDRERYWIQHYKDLGYTLLNKTNGGDSLGVLNFRKKAYL